MKILIAEDDPSSKLLLQTTLEMWGYEVISTTDGKQAWDALRKTSPPSLAILDWMMPELDGLEVCRKVRQIGKLPPIYIILLTAKGNKEDIVTGFDAGADDYMVKPFNREELRARVTVGVRVVQLQQELTKRVHELEDALSKVKLLQGLIPICSYCKKIRDDKNYWQQVEAYIVKHSEARFSHSVCPDCYTDHVEPQLKKLKMKQNSRNKK